MPIEAGSTSNAALKALRTLLSTSCMLDTPFAVIGPLMTESADPASSRDEPRATIYDQRLPGNPRRRARTEELGAQCQLLDAHEAATWRAPRSLREARCGVRNRLPGLGRHRPWRQHIRADAPSELTARMHPCPSNLSINRVTSSKSARAFNANVQSK